MSDYRKLVQQATEKNSTTVQIYKRDYSRRCSYILDLIKELKRDFPLITEDDISIGTYACETVKGIMFIEISFNVAIKIPEGYKEVKNLDYIV